MRISEDERFVICFNPEAAERDAAIRVKMIARLEDAIAGSDQLGRDKRTELPPAGRMAPCGCGICPPDGGAKY